MSSMKNKNLNLFYIHELLFAVSETMLGFVLVLFMYKLFDHVSAIFFFNTAWSILYGLIFIPVFNLAQRLGQPKYFMALGMIFYVLSLSLFGLTTPEKIHLFYWGTFFFTLYISFYWMTRHWFFSVISDYKKVGKQVSSLAILRMFVGFLSPIIAGYLSFFVSFNAAFWMGAIAGLFSIVPILFFDAKPHGTEYTLKEVKAVMKRPEIKAISPTYVWEGISFHMHSPAWILIFGIFIGSIKDLGLLVGVATFVTAVLTRLAGHWFDARKRKKLMTRLTFVNSLGLLSYSAIFFYPSLGFIYLIDIGNRFIGSMHRTVADSYLYAYGNKVHPVHFALNREVHLSIVRPILNIILAIAFLFLPAEALWILIILGAITSLGWLYVVRSDHLLH